jgi:hypothetical protein
LILMPLLATICDQFFCDKKQKKKQLKPYEVGQERAPYRNERPAHGAAPASIPLLSRGHG